MVTHQQHIYLDHGISSTTYLSWSCYLSAIDLVWAWNLTDHKITSQAHTHIWLAAAQLGSIESELSCNCMWYQSNSSAAIYNNLCYYIYKSVLYTMLRVAYERHKRMQVGFVGTLLALSAHKGFEHFFVICLHLVFDILLSMICSDTLSI